MYARGACSTFNFILDGGFTSPSSSSSKRVFDEMIKLPGREVKLFTSSVINLYLYEGAGFAILNNFRDVRKRLRREILRKIGFSLENHLQYMCNLFFEKNLYCYIINSLLLIINSF